MNEPRWKDTQYEWNGGNAEGHQVVNRLNQVFVDTVRASGGRNELRHLMVPTYAASSDQAAVAALSRGFPQNDDKIIASIHAYVPHRFALRTDGTPHWNFETASDVNDVEWMFNRLKSEFIDKGIPVIMGETGAVDRNNNLQSRVNWTKHFFSTARELGIPCFWWDNGLFYRPNSNSEFFGMMNRNAAVFVFPEIIEAIMEN
jgi:endoglucanase